MNNSTFVQFIRIFIAYSPIILSACGAILFGFFTYYLAFHILGKSRASKIIIWLVLLFITFSITALASMMIYGYLNPSIQGPHNLRFLR